MSDRARDLLTRGVAAAKAGDKDEALFYLEWVLRAEPTHEQRIRAWEYLAEVHDDPKQKRGYLEDIIMHEPGNAVARRGLAILNGDLQANEQIDATHRGPNEANPEAQPELQEAMFGPDQPQGEATKAKRMVCQTCGGTMGFSPDGDVLRCDYCGREISLYQALQEGSALEEKDFAVALATAKGHTTPVEMQALSCQGCGAAFILGSDVLAMQCPYCGSSHVIEERENTAYIPPEGVLPIQITLDEARTSFYTWLKKHKLFDDVQVAAPSGLYLPAWTFDIAGALVGRTRGYTHGRGVRIPSQTLERPLFYNDLPISASRRLPFELAREITHFNLSELQPYDPRYLADWPAATYQISAAEASLVARKQAWEHARDIIGPELKAQAAGPFGSPEVEMTFSSAKMYVDAFKLILLPVWLFHYRYEQQVYQTIVNGQNGRVRGQTPARGLKGWLGKMLGRN